MSCDFTKQKEKTLLIKEKSLRHIVPYNEILWLECDGNIVTVFLVGDNTPVSYTNSLTDIEKCLGEFGFLRINHNKIVNMAHVKKMKSKTREIILGNDEVLTVSRRKWQIIKNFFDS